VGGLRHTKLYLVSIGLKLDRRETLPTNAVDKQGK